MTTSLASVAIAINASQGAFGSSSDVSHLSPQARTYSMQQPANAGWTVDLYLSTESGRTDYSAAYTFSPSSPAVFTVPDAAFGVKAFTRIVGTGSPPTCSVSALDITSTPGIPAGNVTTFGAGAAPPASFPAGLYLAGELGSLLTYVSSVASYNVLDTDTVIVCAPNAGGTTLVMVPPAAVSEKFLWISAPNASPANPVILSYAAGIGRGGPTTWEITSDGGWVCLILDQLAEARIFAQSETSESALVTGAGAVAQWQRFIPCDFTATTYAVALPTTHLLDGEEHTFFDATGTATSGHTLTINAGSKNINGASTLTSAIATAYGRVKVRYSETLGHWNTV